MGIPQYHRHTHCNTIHSLLSTKSMSPNPSSTTSSSSSSSSVSNETRRLEAESQQLRLVVDQLGEMRRQERSWYRVANYYQPASDKSLPDLVANSSWRQKICHWSYSVVDHFGFSREVVAISLSIFDRFMATRGNRTDSNTALLVSLTSLHMAIKLNETKKVKLSTLAGLSRGQFRTKTLEAMEWSILSSLSWLVHPPTAVSFISYLLLLLPLSSTSELDKSIRNNFFELSRYQAELSTCDPYFVDHDPSMVAFASILNVMEDMINAATLMPSTRDRFLQDVAEHVKLYHYDPAVKCAQQRLRSVFATSMGHDTDSEDSSSMDILSAGQQQQHASTRSSQDNNNNNTTTTTSRNNESKNKNSPDNHSETGGQMMILDNNHNNVHVPKGYRCGGRRTVNPM